MVYGGLSQMSICRVNLRPSRNHVLKSVDLTIARPSSQFKQLRLSKLHPAFGHNWEISMQISAKHTRNISFAAWLKEHVLYDTKSLIKVMLFWIALAVYAYLS